jgi:hypothetical protein
MPHPGPLPSLRGSGEGEPFAAFLKNSQDWICRTLIRKIRNVRLLFLLPGGEGQDEGDRKIIIYFTGVAAGFAPGKNFVQKKSPWRRRREAVRRDENQPSPVQGRHLCRNRILKTFSSSVRSGIFRLPPDDVAPTELVISVERKTTNMPRLRRFDLSHA